MSAEKITNLLACSRPLEQHPLSAAFPAMDAEAFAALKESVQKVGVQNAVVLFEGKVLDGWHRYTAAQQTGTPCPAVHLDADADPKDFVIAQNERRRHLTASQIAAAVVAVHAWAPTGRPNSQGEENRKPTFHFPKTNGELADIAGVSIQTIKQAKAVQTQAAPGIQEAVKTGAVSVSDATTVAKRPPEEQEAIAAAGPEAIKMAAKAPKKGKPKAEPTQPSDASHGGEADELRRLLAEKDAHIDELAGMLKETMADNELMSKAFEADDQLAAAMAEVKRCTAMVQVLESRVTGLMNELAECKRMLKGAQRRAERAEAELKKAPF